MSKIVLAFDLYGTLLDTSSVSKKLQECLGLQDEIAAKTVAQAWRKYQLEYTWRGNSMKHRRKWVMELLRLPYSPSSVLTPNLCCCPVLMTLFGVNKDEYRPFAEITENSLLHALDESGLGFTDANVGPVLEAYRSLEPFPDVVQALNDITAEQRFECVLFSNGSRDMLSQSFRGSDELGRYWSCFKALVTADDVKKYKPAPEVYQHLTRVVQKTGDKPTIWLVSSNPFDIVGARACGLQALWIDRIGHGWQDRQASRPSAIVQSLTDLQEAVT